ncbi:MAG: DUF2589 domain-containing protein [Ruminococcus sp.]|jgi:hypothetical protein|nr:DUF2589 domain-containing protein [Ruminococcus sp.]
MAEDVASKFNNVPIETLICSPILAVARGQQALIQVYLDTVNKLAFKTKDGKATNETNILKMNVTRSIAQNDGNVKAKDYTIEAPLIAMVPIPALTMDEITVDFDMEVSAQESSEDKSHAEAGFEASYSAPFGFSGSVTGKVSSDSEHKRSSDSSATYKIHARAVQQPPSEGMAKLTALMSQGMELIPTAAKSGG